jgi:hypothetical protein
MCSSVSERNAILALRGLRFRDEFALVLLAPCLADLADLFEIGIAQGGAFPLGLVD